MKNNTISRKLVQRELPPRKSRHGKEQIMARDFDPLHHDLDEVGIRKSNTLYVASGPTQKKGKLNVAPTYISSPHGRILDTAPMSPGWWKEEK